MTAWKDLERTVAKVFNGYRIPRGADFSESLPDVIAAVPPNLFNLAEDSTLAFTVECKYRKTHPWINRYKKIKKEKYNSHKFIVITKEVVRSDGSNDRIIILPLDYFHDYITANLYVPKLNTKYEIPSYLFEYLGQSLNYAVDFTYRTLVNFAFARLAKMDSLPKFDSFVSLVVLGQRNDKLRIVVAYESQIDRFIKNRS